MPASRRQKFTLLLFFLAFGTRVAFLVVHGIHRTPDTTEYELLARNILRAQTFSMSVNPPMRSTIRRPPVYPLFLALVIKVRGGPVTVAIVQALLDALVCALLFLMASRIVRGRLGFAVALLYAFHPGPISASCTLLSETLFTVLFFAAAFLAMKASERLSAMLALCSGIVFGMATLCRSIALLYVACVGFLFFLRHFRRTAVFIAIGAAAVIAPWIVRSSRLAGRFVMIQAPSFIDWYLPTLTWVDTKDETVLWRYFDDVDPYGVRISKAVTAAEVMSADDFGRQQAVINIRRNPREYVRRQIGSYPHLFLTTFDRFTGLNRSIGDVARAHDVPGLALKLGLMLLFSVLPMVAACMGLPASYRNLTASAAAAAWIVTLAMHIPMWVEYRYWIPVVPFQLLTAAIGVQAVTDRMKRDPLPLTE